MNDGAAKGIRHAFEFRGTGRAYFGIWIVNLALTIVTLGIFSAWAKVRTRRYFNGSTWLAGHSFDYHASGTRILIGRSIALGLLIAYQLSVTFKPVLVFPWILAGLWLFPWLANSSIRFNARYTSYRNVRFNFTATDVEALVALIVWPVVSMFTAMLLWPFAQRQKDYFFINNHTFGGRYFETNFPTGSMYGIFAAAIGLYLAGLFLLAGLSFSAFWLATDLLHLPFTKLPAQLIGFTTLGVIYLPGLLIAPAIHTMIVNLAVGHTEFDGRHRLESTMSPPVVAWIVVSNVVFCLLSLGLYYPWAKVRLERYKLNHMALVADGDIDSYVSDVSESQSAVGEEIGSLFSFDFGL
jgi:uncharacterized membrane protein YjgN (DUF898 family)